ncbi:MAG: class I SAM-dependent rRNA methyltransferase [Edaphobacter sp.]|uniref:class I SAM-dependent rRNA methyltransferase n=1 Tax=Edaphobacter sp. TaxID=1934404 RepID=UPI00239BE5E6|nr:class I SAM-dependent rRNA methyltransferase [Edaphobacter sp.]MDE1176705.1 class I SAM-dependent rRNA methyltransferase [Edaphobacter sp.]
MPREHQPHRATKPRNDAREREPRLEPGAAHGPAVTISRRAADRLRAGHLWVYRSDLEAITPALDEESIAPGALVAVLDNRGIPVGSGLWSAASQIAVRVVSAEPKLTREAYLADLEFRLASALTLRSALAPTDTTNDSCRLVFAEADQLPGIVADRYNDLVILQLLAQGTAQDDVREVFTSAVRGHFGDRVATIVERPDPRVRELEELAPAPSAPLFSANENDEPKLATVFTINGLQLHYDASAGQKTGAFLDQRLNYAAAAAHAHGRALDVCTYQGGFALHMARTCDHVTGVDASRSALEVADRNLELNRGILRAEVDWIEADAFELLREYEATSQRFDTIVLDPPAFAKSKRAVEGALRGYKELNLRAMKMLPAGGTLVTCSCSHHVSREDFLSAIVSAAADAGRRVQVLETRAAAPDHPEILTLPETFYLKCILCRML